VSFAMIGVIAAEFISADEGLGYYSMTSTQQFDPSGCSPRLRSSWRCGGREFYHRRLRAASPEVAADLISPGVCGGPTRE